MKTLPVLFSGDYVTVEQTEFPNAPDIWKLYRKLGDGRWECASIDGRFRGHFVETRLTLFRRCKANAAADKSAQGRQNLGVMWLPIAVVAVGIALVVAFVVYQLFKNSNP